MNDLLHHRITESLNRLLAIGLVWLGVSGMGWANENDGFSEIGLAAGLDHQQRIPVVLGSAASMTGGVGVADFDGDGWEDLIFTRYDDHPVVYLNNGDGTFRDVSSTAGILMVQGSNGVAVGDIDNDGDQDIYLTQSDQSGAVPARHRFFVNGGSGSFNDESLARGATLGSRSRYGTSAAFGDYDRDGWLDLHVCEWGYTSPGRGHTKLLKNSGSAFPGVFFDVTEEVGASFEETVGFGYLLGDMVGQWAFTNRISDLDGDGIADLVASGDFGTSKLLWGEEGGTFAEGTAAAGIGSDENGMGMALGDYDGDGDDDIFISSIYDVDAPLEGQNAGFNHGTSGNRLYRNEGNRTFVDVTEQAGVRDAGWGWGSSFSDFDNDGNLDLAVTNGFFIGNYSVDRSRLFIGDGNGAFAERGVEWGFDDTTLGRALAPLDFDRDGDLDIVVVTNGDRPLLYRNDLESTDDWVQIELVGTSANRDGLGSVITVENGDSTWRREHSGGGGYLSADSKVLHFGLGSTDGFVDVRVRWPGGGVQEFDAVPVGTRYRIEQDASGGESPLVLGTTISGAEPALEIVVSSDPGRRYRLQQSPDGMSWSNQGEEMVASGNRIRFVVDLPAGAGSRLFRVAEIAP